MDVGTVEGLARLNEASESAALSAATGNDPSPTVRAAMTFALAKAGKNDPVTLTEFFASDKTALQAQAYLLELGPAALPGLAPALKDPNPGVRAGTADVIGAVIIAHQLGADGGEMGWQQRKGGLLGRDSPLSVACLVLCLGQHIQEVGILSWLLL